MGEKRRRQPFVLGVTGGVGAGKSTVLSYLENSYGIPCYRTDDMAKALYRPGTPVFQGLLEILGSEVLLPSEPRRASASTEQGQRDGIAAEESAEQPALDFKKMAALMYADPAKKTAVDALVHPAVWQAVRAAIEREAALGKALVCVETAIPDASFQTLCTDICFVYARQEIRMERLAESRGYSREKAAAIIAAQCSDEAYRSCADAEIDNSGSEAETRRQLDAYLHAIINDRMKRNTNT